MKNIQVQAIFKIVCNHFARRNCRARVSVNATHASPCQKKQFSKTLITRQHPIGGIFILWIPRGVGAFGLRLGGRTHSVPPPKRKPNTQTPPTILDKYSPNCVSCRIGFSTLYPSSRGQTCQLQDQWPWWQRTFLGRVSPKSHGVCACLRPSDPS
jgi:hypothetical protein